MWSNFIFPLFNVDISIEQDSILSSILSTFYILPIFHIFEKRFKNLNIPISFLSFINNGFLILQEKSFEKTNAHLFCSYNIILSLLNQFGLIVKHRKSKVFHFFRSHRLFNSLSLDLTSLGGSTLYLKDTWKYLCFIFNRKQSFQQHINFYTNKVLLTVKYMKILGNSTIKLPPHQKWLLYRTCVLPIMIYRFPLWYFNEAPLSYPLKELRKMQ